MRTGQGCAEFAVFAFGADAAGKWDKYLLASRASTIYRHLQATSEVELHIITERARATRATAAPVVRHAKIHADLTVVRSAWT
jgi:hypothetical protein